MMAANRCVMAAFLSMLLVSGCSDTLWRRSNLEVVPVGEHKAIVAWLRLQPDVIDAVVFQRCEGPPCPGAWLDLDQARHAAGNVAAERCGGEAVPLSPSIVSPGQHYLLRYRCGGSQ